MLPGDRALSNNECLARDEDQVHFAEEPDELGKPAF